MEYQYNRKLYLKNTSAEVLEKVGENPMFTVNQYGKGNVYYLNMPLEKNQIEKHNAFEANQHAVYQYLAKECLTNKPVVTDNPFLGVTIHRNGEKTYVVIVNYSDKSQDMNLKIAEGYTVEKVYHGDSLKLEPFGAFVSLISKN